MDAWVNLYLFWSDISSCSFCYVQIKYHCIVKFNPCHAKSRKTCICKQSEPRSDFSRRRLISVCLQEQSIQGLHYLPAGVCQPVFFQKNLPTKADGLIQYWDGRDHCRNSVREGLPCWYCYLLEPHLEKMSFWTCAPMEEWSFT